jgi:hypothetical protein
MCANIPSKSPLGVWVERIDIRANIIVRWKKQSKKKKKNESDTQAGTSRQAVQTEGFKRLEKGALSWLLANYF